MTVGRFLLALSLLAAAARSAPAQLGDAGTQTVTLFSQFKHHDHDKAVMRVRPPAGVKSARRVGAVSDHTLRFGGMNLDGDGDWLEVPYAHGSRSQIKDLGKLEWSEVYDVPILHASVAPHPGPVELSYSSGSLKISPENVMVKALAGHLYLVRFKDEDSDFYLMFRVESLKPNDECKLSWKYVPSPEP